MKEKGGGGGEKKEQIKSRQGDADCELHDRRHANEWQLTQREN